MIIHKIVYSYFNLYFLLFKAMQMTWQLLRKWLYSFKPVKGQLIKTRWAIFGDKPFMLKHIADSNLFNILDSLWLAPLPISTHGLWEWFMILILLTTLTYINVLHWIVRLYYYGFLVNEGNDFILVIQTLYPSVSSVLHNKDAYSTFSIVWSTTCLFIVLKSH